MTDPKCPHCGADVTGATNEPAEQHMDLAGYLVTDSVVTTYEPCGCSRFRWVNP